MDSWVPCIVGDRERRGGSNRVRVLMLVLGGATREPAGGGSGGKLDGRSSSGTADGRVEDGSAGGSVEHEMVGTDDLTGGGIRICLLYTSPSPRDRQKSRMPSSA